VLLGAGLAAIALLGGAAWPLLSPPPASGDEVANEAADLPTTRKRRKNRGRKHAAASTGAKAASPTEVRGDKDSYEWSRTQAVLKALKLDVDPAPEGKRVAWVRVVRDKVFVKGEVFPVFLNALHVRTRERIIRRELLLKEGMAYVDERAEETMRILRGLGIFSLVRVVAVRTDDPETVGLLVHTRDIWSLRLEQSFNITTQVDSLNVTLVERNLAGTGTRLSFPFSLRPDRYSIAQSYGARRAFGKPISVGESGGLRFSRATNRPDGGFGSAAVSRPFFNLAQKFAFSLTGSFDTRVRRTLSNGEPIEWVPEGQSEAAALRIWRQQDIDGRAAVRFRQGRDRRHTIRVSFFASDRQSRVIDETALAPGREQDFLTEVAPPSRREIGPGIGYDVFFPRYTRFVNLDTYGQTENVRTGPSFSASASAPLRALGSNVEARIIRSGVGWTWAGGDALLRLSGSGSARWQDGIWSDQRLSATLRAATPMFGPVRFVTRFRLSMRFNDTTNSLVALGGNSGLRGFPSQYLADFGAHWARLNVEMRTKALSWRGILLGGVLFYDTGTVFVDPAQIRLSHGFGLGLRLLLPQLNRSPWGADGGFSVNPFQFVPTIRSAQVVPIN
jgi:hypothetical protein